MPHREAAEIAYLQGQADIAAAALKYDRAAMPTQRLLQETRVQLLRILNRAENAGVQPIQSNVELILEVLER